MSDETATLDKVKRLVYEVIGVDEKEIQLDSNLVNDLGADSLDHVELVMALEDEFEIEIADEEAEKAVTVRDLLNIVNGRLAAA